jgi:anti-sigma regulatory factor (Ser/Thr protein kinase)
MSGSNSPPPGTAGAAAFTVTTPLPADASAAALARQFVEDNRDHIRADLIEDAQLLVSELVTNAVRHGRPDITLCVSVDPPAIGIAVRDHGESLPASPQGPPPPTQPSGRGLLIVDALASTWGVTPNPEPAPGKVVWFEIQPGRHG